MLLCLVNKNPVLPAKFCRLPPRYESTGDLAVKDINNLNLTIMKVFRKHNFHGLTDAWVKSFKGWGNDIIFTFTVVESKAHVFNSKAEALEHIKTLDHSNHTYIIL